MLITADSVSCDSQMDLPANVIYQDIFRGTTAPTLS